MRLTTNHPDPEISDAVMEFLHDRVGVTGSEDHLLDEPITNILGRAEIIDLEEGLSAKLNENIDLPKGLKLVQYFTNQQTNKTENGKRRNTCVKC